jgi:hypothetical protein
VLIVFVVILLLITAQRASSLNSQSYSALQLIAQDVAGYLDQAVFAGSGYNITAPLLGSIGSLPYNITVSTTGVVIVSSKVGSQIITAQAYSSARNLFVNGTRSAKSSNAIGLYVLSNVGNLKISNLNGLIYVDQVPPSFLGTNSIPTYLSARVLGKSLVGSFNGVNSFAVENGISALNKLSQFSILGWFDLVGSPTNQIIYSEAAVSNGITFQIKVNPAGKLMVCTYSAGSVPCVTGPNTEVVVQNQWTFFALTYNGPAGGSGTLNMSLQNTTNTMGGFQSENSPTSIYEGIGFNAANYIKSATGVITSNNFNGLIGNIQLYNTTLSNTKLRTIYTQGISAQPIITTNIIGWYKLAGDTRDYSGNNNPAFASNITYKSITQIGAYPLLQNGSQIPSTQNALTGFSASNGILGANGLFVSNYSNVGFGYLNSNGARGLINLTITEFNGQRVFLTNKQLVAWWPADEGSGNVLGDFAAPGNPVVQLSDPKTYNGFPAWSLVNRNITNFQAANFTNGYLLVNPVNAYNSITTTNTFTAVAWIYWEGPASASLEGIVGDMPTTSSPGWAFYENGQKNTIDLYLDGNTFGYPAQPITFLADKWLMVSAQYNGNSGLANIYLNGSVIKPDTAGAGIPLTTNTYYIGTASWSPNTGHAFNGLISNEQVYSAYLNQIQINSLYLQGPTGAPIGGAGLIGWWALDGNPNDFSSVQNNGAAQSTVVYQNQQYLNYTAIGAPRYAISENPTGANTFNSIGSVNLGISGSATVIAWINPKQKQAAPIYNNIFTYGTAICPPNGNAIEIGMQATGIPFFSAGCDDTFPTNGPSVNFNSWNFLAATLSGTAVHFYLNGQWLNTTISTTANAQAGPVVIGGRLGSGTANVFNGSITDVQVYNTVLTSSILTQIYQAGLPPTVRLNITT